MRIIDAYYVACDRVKDSIVFQKRLVLFLFFATQGSFLEARDWTVYLFMQASGSYQEALASVQQIENSLKDDYEGRIAVFIDVQTGDRLDHFLIERGRMTTSTLRSRAPTHGESVKEGVTKAFGSVTEGKTLLILSGHGTGILAPPMTATQKKWFYEPDEGSFLAPCKQYCSARYEQFCKQVQHIMQGKSILSAQGGSSFLSTNELRELVRFTYTLLGKKLDILGFDSCYMAMFEVGYEVKDSVRYMVASQDCEEKDGWSYDKVLQALKTSSAAQVCRQLVYSYERSQMSRGLDRFSLSVFDLSYCEQVAQALDALVQRMSLSKDLLEPLCRARTALHSVTGLSFYGDLREFLETFYKELSEYQITAEIEWLLEDLLHARQLLKLMVRASVAGPSCRYLKGCSIYFPFAHIDSSYKGSFVQEHLWGSFLRYFTTGL